jgi:cell fate regulator YaaT (PSP1 superfamily)
VNQPVEVRFKGNRRGFFEWTGEQPPRLNDPVVVEAERGLDLGFINSTGETAAKKCTGCDSCGPTDEPAEPAAILKVSRSALPGDLAQHADLRKSEDDIRREVSSRAAELGLEMRISDTEWQWDRARLTIYFTAERRVDFRALVRELATRYRTRIDLRQIGVRDEAARLGGIGRCGRELCCSTWLTEPGPVNLGLAKDQNLSLNPAQISGGCGRLLCCLKFEHEFYLSARKRFPKEGRTVETMLGTERVVAVDIFRERIFLRSAADATRVVPMVALASEMEQAAGLRNGTPA